jgi:signal transduction histidine kinase
MGFLIPWLDDVTVTMSMVEAPSSIQETPLAQSAKMAMLGELVAGVTHEINNALNFITCTLPQLKRNFEGLEELLAAYDHVPLPDPDATAIHQIKENIRYTDLLPGIQKRLDRSIEGAARVEKIIKNLRAFSGAHQDDWVKADLHQGLDSTMDLLAYDVNTRIDLIKQYHPDPIILNCQPAQLNQVFMNLLINASHAIDNQGQIIVRTFRDAEWVVVEVSDNGHGIPAETLPHIFEPFFTTKMDGRGTGLGLSVCKKIIENHQGHLEVESAPSQGTTFRVRLKS